MEKSQHVNPVSWCKKFVLVTRNGFLFFLFFFQNTDNINEKLAIVLFQQEVTKLSALSSDINLNIISEEELIFGLLDIDSDMHLTWHCLEYANRYSLLAMVEKHTRSWSM